MTEVPVPRGMTGSRLAAHWTVRNVAFVAATAFATLVFLGSLYVLRGQSPITTALAPPVATATATATVALASTTPASTTAASAAPASAAPTASPTASGTFADPTYKLAVVLPTPYRKSLTLSFDAQPSGHPAAQDAFTARTTADEATFAAVRCETACEVWNYVALIAVYTDAAGQTPRQWFDAGGAGHATGEKVDAVTIDGRAALKVTNGARFPLQYIVADRGRMYLLAYEVHSLQPVPAGASTDKLDQILASFRFLP
ncbi:MAG: hypothetical protein ABI888_02710 [Chloroflexota bacterium]